MKGFWLCLWFILWSVQAVADPEQAQTLRLLGRSHVEGYQLPLGGEDRRWLQAKGALTLGTSAPDYAPFDITLSGQDYEGLTADYAQLLGELLQVPVHVRRYAHRADAVKALHDGEIDLLGSANDYEFQDSSLARAADYADDQPVLVTRADEQAKAEGEMSGVRVAMLDHYRPTAGFTALYPDAHLQLYPSALDALGAVAFGRADVYVGDAITAGYQIANYASDNMQLADFSRLESSRFGFAVRTQDTRLARLVRAAIESIPETERMTLQHRWNADAQGMPGQHRLQLSDQEQAWLVQHPRVQLAVDPSFAPFTFIDQHGQLRGLTADVLARVSQLTGLQFDIHQEPSVAAMIEKVSSGSIDMIGALTPSHSRTTALTFTRPYLSTPYVLISPSGAVTDLDDLAGKTVALTGGDALYEDWDQRFAGVRMVSMATNEQVFDSVERGTVSAGIAPLIAARYRIARIGNTRWQVAATLGGAQARVAFATRRDAWQLQSILNKALLSLPPQELQTLTYRWRGDGVDRGSYWQRHRRAIMTAGAVVFALLVLCAAALAWQRRLLARLHAAQLEADAANRAKTTFLATMSHEIRTPMNAVLGMLEIASQQADQGVLDRAAIDVASASANSLLELIGDILDVVRIESGQLTLRPQPVDLRQLALSTVRAFEGLARQKHIALEMTADSLKDFEFDVMLDPMRFKQVLSNLLGNGIKFTEQGGVSLSLHVIQDPTTALWQLQCSVRDTGVGIDAANQQRLFQPFSQVSNQPAGGSGLGLMISRNLCELMGGRLDLASVPGQGTEVTFQLPVERVQRQSVSEPQQPAAVATLALRVLVVDDYAPNRMLLTRQLEWLGHDVTVADDGEAAMGLWQPGWFDVVITDCNMPRMDGYTLTREIRLREARVDSPAALIFGFTANAQPQEQARCLEAGMDDCLFKPLGLDRLRLALQSQSGADLPVQPPLAALWQPDALEQLAGGDSVMANALLDELLLSLEQDDRDLMELQHKHDRLGLNDVAHRIKGGAKIVRAAPLVACCEALEACVAQGGDEDVSQAAIELRQAANALAAAINLHRS